MKNILFAAALSAGIMSATSAFADRWVVPTNGTVSAISIPNGDVMMKIQLPAKEFTAISGMMTAKNNTCTLFQMAAGGQQNAVIVVCGATREYVPNY